MKVKELIKHLSLYNNELEVIINDVGRECTLDLNSITVNTETKQVQLNVELNDIPF